MRNIDFEYYLLDKNDNPKHPLKLSKTNKLNNILSCNITYTSLGRLKASLELTMVDIEGSLIDFRTDRINPVVIIDYTPYSLGVFLISSPSREVDDINSTRTLTCYSKLKILDNDKVTGNYYLPSGSNVINAVRRLLGSNKYKIDDCDKTTSTEHEWAIGTAKLDIINDLLDIINYQSLTVDTDGYFTTNKYVSPENRSIEIKYTEGKDGVISAIMTEECDYYDVPNVFVRHTNDVNISPSMVATYPIQSGSETITIDGEAANVNVEEVSDVSDVTTLYEIAKKDAYNARNIYSHLTFSTEINPQHGYLNCVEVKCGDIHDKYIETEWSFDLEVGALMQHTARKVVDLDAN